MAFLDRFFFNFGEFLGSRPKFEKREINADAGFYVLKNPIIEEACQTLKILGEAIGISSLVGFWRFRDTSRHLMKKHLDWVEAENLSVTAENKIRDCLKGGIF